ncbi:MAG: hypothetical protein ACFFG0_07180 [Candidatus Thorarchaeota archaeon]
MVFSHFCPAVFVQFFIYIYPNIWHFMRLKINEKIYNWKKLKLSRKISSVMKYSLCIAILVQFILVFYSLGTLFSGIEIPSDVPEINLDFSHYSRLKNTSVRIPYHITNNGIFDMDRITLKVSIDILYTENLGYTERRRTIFSKQESIGYCHVGDILVGIFQGDYLSLNTTALGLYLNEVSTVDGELRLMKIEFSTYVVGSFHLWLAINDIDITGGFCNG